MNYEDLSLDDLIETLKVAAADDIPGDGQEAAVDRINALKAEIAKRDGHDDRYRALLNNSNPRVRYSAALTVKHFDPVAALAVFKQLSNTDSGVSAKSWIEVRELRLQGYA